LLGLRAADPFLQYGILAKGWGSSAIEAVGSRTLPLGPALVTNTFLDGLGLSPYRLILLAMATGSAVKQNYWLLGVSNEEMPPASSVLVSVFNTLCNSVNNLLFVCAATSASVNGEHFPQTPLLVGSAMYAVGIVTETVAEVQRMRFKKDPANKGKVYRGGLFGTARHVNYGGYTLWRAGYALAAGGWTWGAVVLAWFTFDFSRRGIPVLSHYCEERVSSSRAVEPDNQADLKTSTVNSGKSTSATPRTSCSHTSTRFIVGTTHHLLLSICSSCRSSSETPQTQPSSAPRSHPPRRSSS